MEKNRKYQMNRKSSDSDTRKITDIFDSRFRFRRIVEPKKSTRSHVQIHIIRNLYIYVYKVWSESLLRYEFFLHSSGTCNFLFFLARFFVFRGHPAQRAHFLTHTKERHKSLKKQYKRWRIAISRRLCTNKINESLFAP